MTTEELRIRSFLVRVSASGKGGLRTERMEFSTRSKGQLGALVGDMTHKTNGPEGEPPGPSLSLGRGNGYSMRLMMLNMGRYSAITAKPTAPPTKKIMTGSMSAVRESTVADTSLS